MNTKNIPKPIRTQAEESVLSALFLSQGKRLRENELAIEDFSDPFCRRVFESICRLYENQGCIDPMAVSLEVGNYAEITRIIGLEVSSIGLSSYIEKMKSLILEEKIQQIRSFAACKIKIGEDPISLSLRVAQEIDAVRDRYGKSVLTNDLKPAIDALFQKIRNKEKSDALFFGFAPIDDLTHGLLPSEDVILAGRPSCGKTALALQLMKLLAKEQIKSFFLSIEMGAPSLAGRLLAQAAMEDTRMAVRQPDRLSDENREHFLKQEEELRSLAGFIEVCALPWLNFEGIKVKMREAVRRGAKIAFLDYLQLVSCASKQNRNAEIEELSRNWKNLLKELQIPGIMLSQLNRDVERERRLPCLADLRDSGAIEQDADIVWFLAQRYPKQKDQSPNPTEIILIQAKGRDQGTGRCDLYFNRTSQGFYSVEKGE